MDLQSANGFLNMAANIKSSGGEIDEATAEIASNMLNSFDNLPDSLDEAGRNALLGLIYGMEEQIPGLENTSQMSANEIVDTIKSYLGIASPSTVLDAVGQNAIEGLIQGMGARAPQLAATAQKIMAALVKIFTQDSEGLKQVGQQIIDNMLQGAQHWKEAFCISPREPSR